MDPIKTTRSDVVFRLTPGSDVGALPVFRHEDSNGATVLVSTWRPTAEEREAIAEGANIDLNIWGTGQPPAFLAVSDAEEMID